MLNFWSWNGEFADIANENVDNEFHAILILRMQLSVVLSPTIQWIGLLY